MTEIDLPQSDALRVATALWRARGPHVARVLDVHGPAAGRASAASAPGDVRLVLSDGSVALDVPLARGLALGEAVTVLVPLAACVEGLAAGGVVHGAIAASTVRIDERGAPVLAGFESARLIDDVSEEADGDGLHGARWNAIDRAAWCQLARTVLESVRADSSAVEAQVREELLARLAVVDPEVQGSLVSFAERLLTAVAPLPVQLGPTVLPSVGPPPEPAPQRATTRRASRAVVSLAGSLRHRLAAAGRVRARFWVPAAVAGCAFAAALVVLPALDAVSGVAPVRDAASVPSVMPSPSAVPISSEPVQADLARDDAIPGAALRGADPVRAALDLRPDASTGVVVDDYGDIVLLELRTSSGAEEVLLERTDAGWRLRDTLPRER